MDTEIENKAMASAVGQDETIAEGEFYADAKIITPYNETDYSKEITVTLGSKRDSKSWKPQKMPLGALIAKQCRHEEGQKDGPSVVFADMHPGQRLKLSVKTIMAIGLDIDTGTPTAVVDAALAKLNCLAVRYTTHSNGKTSTEFRKDKVLKKFPEAEEITSDMMQDFCRTVENWDETVVESVEYAEEDHTEKGIVIRVSHIPMPKHRVCIPLKDNFVISEQGKTQIEAMAKWGKIPAAMAEKLGVPFDRSCTDPSRLYYLPRHAKGKPFSISLFGGPLFDWTTLGLDNQFDAIVEEMNKGKGKSKTLEGKKLGRWSMKTAHGFQIMDAIEAHCPEKMRGKGSAGYNICCPFDEDHSNAGDETDAACFAINAAEGGNEFFVVHCLHESCREYTNLDFLGKMIRDKWFPKETIDDPDYNIAEPEDVPQSEVSAKISKEDKARAAYQAAIDSLTPKSNSDDIGEVLQLIADANLNQLDQEGAENDIKAKTGRKIGTIRTSIAKLKPKIDSKSKPIERAENGAALFQPVGKYHFDEACRFCMDEMLERNRAIGYPSLCRIGHIAHEMRIDAFGKVEFVQVSQNALWSMLTNAVMFVEGSGTTTTRCKVPEDVAKHLYEQAWSWLPEAPEIATAPRYLKSGALILNPGYHYDSKQDLNHYITIAAEEQYEVPATPTKENVVEALRWLDTELLNDFAFCEVQSDGFETREVGRANALAMLATPFMRPLFNHARTPMFIGIKALANEGGSALPALSVQLFDGVWPAPLRLTSNEEEFAKAFVACMREGRTYIFLDDAVDLNNKDLHRYLSSSVLSGRILGTNNNFSMRNIMNWLASGINPKINAETARRSVPLRLNSKDPNPGNRHFRHPHDSGIPFEEFVETHRSIAVGHILTLIEYWLANGEPIWTERKMSGFEEWARAVGGMLDLCGVKGFLNHRKLTSMDIEVAAYNEFARFTVQENGDRKVSFSELFNLHTKLGSAIVGTRSGGEAQEHFMKQLSRITDRAFDVGEVGKTKRYLFRQVYDESTDQPKYVMSEEKAKKA